MLRINSVKTPGSDSIVHHSVIYNIKMKINFLMLAYLLGYISTTEEYTNYDNLIVAPPPFDNGSVTYGQGIAVKPEILANDNNFLQPNDKDYLYVPVNAVGEFNNTFAQGVMDNAKMFGDILTSSDSIEKFVKAQEQKYQSYFNEINKLEYQKVYNKLNPTGGAISIPDINFTNVKNVSNVINLPDSLDEFVDTIK
jgi:hypothetical protein